ncbi:DUF2004 domain-containing protein [Dactylosporangium siamense]|uniref:DUF2004 domain-containing protein n=1 Tax=Dactylosporangium siamense TaxID=685454 RepID=A0A919U7H7_9ACTN|nr:DUF2004 domain-containing protein [Dactylosporangium siamense]GIG45534.1 hypothetical protein Dsi01nite_035750 [Dactylosporangium siamense]
MLDITVEHAGRTVDVDVTPRDAEVPAGMLDDVAGCDARARQAIRADLDAVIRDYLDFDGSDNLPQAPEPFLAALHLVRIGLYPDEPAAVFDYTLGRDLTDQLVAVTFDGHGTVTGVAVES